MTAALPSILAIEELAQRAVENLPPLFRQHLGQVVLRVEDVADDATLRAMEIDDPLELLGLYVGNPVGDSGGEWTGALPPTIHLYRLPILEQWMEGGDSLEHVVAHVLVHEVGHHFGLSDDDMHAIEDDDRPDWGD